MSSPTRTLRARTSPQSHALEAIAAGLSASTVDRARFATDAAVSGLRWLARLGAAGATRNAGQALDQLRRDHWALAALEARLPPEESQEVSVGA